MPKSNNAARAAQLSLLGISIRENVKSLNLSDDEAKIIIAHAFGPHLVAGYQQQQAGARGGSVKSNAKTIAARANAKRPRKRIA